jgi:phage nucleotide-binding protein
MKLSEMKPNEDLKVLVYGDSGTGKTCFACGFPGPIMVLDFDNKVSSAAAHYAGTDQLGQIDYENFAPVDEKGTSGERANILLGEIKKDLKYKTIVLDSLTTFGDEMMKYLMRINPGIKRNTTRGVQLPTLQDYGLARGFFKAFIQELLNIPCNIVVTAHIQIDKDEHTGAIVRSPMFAGKLAKELPIYFSEVYVSSVKDNKYMAQTQSDYKFSCRTQIKGLGKDVPLEYAALVK